jgi:hypothetical protein
MRTSYPKLQNWFWWNFILALYTTKLLRCVPFWFAPTDRNRFFAQGSSKTSSHFDDLLVVLTFFDLRHIWRSEIEHLCFIHALIWWNYSTGHSRNVWAPLPLYFMLFVSAMNSQTSPPAFLCFGISADTTWHCSSVPRRWWLLQWDDNYVCLDNVIATTGKPNCFTGRGLTRYSLRVEATVI